LSAECLAPDTVFDFFANRSVELDCKIMLSSVESGSAMALNEYLRVFGWTCGLEAVVYLPLLLLKKNGFGRSLLVVIAANIATHPLITYVFPIVFESIGLGVASSVVMKELFAPLVETLVLRRFTNLTWLESATVSFGANFFSWWAGSALSERLF
jgi:hypothetical protein